jgi:hypothetical protein
MNWVNQLFNELICFKFWRALGSMEIFKTLKKYDVWDMPVILKDEKFKIITNFVI